MTERLQSASTAGYHCPKMENDLSPRKTMLVLVIVVGCFAVLWPKVFYPMLVGSANQQIKPSPIDKTTGCCDVISETDVNTIKIMSELCGTIIKADQDKPLTGKEIVQRCRQEVLETCGIDISVVLQEQVRLGQNVKQILDEIRSLNGSLCLKYNYGVAPWKLGVPHRVSVNVDPSNPNIRQERPLHLRSELIHPAFRERGRAIPQPQPATPVRPPPRVVEGRPGPVPGMRPTIGGAGHVVPPPKQGTSSMSVIMPIYTIGIVIFFTYTLMKIIFKKQPESVGGSLYPPVDPDPHFRKEVFESESSRLGARLTRENISSKLGDVELDQLRHRLRETELAMERIVEQMSKVPLKAQDLVNGTLSNGDAVKPQDEEQPTVKVLGMEMTASCEGGKKWSRPDSPVLPTSPPPPVEPVPPPQEIYLEGALPAQSHLLVADSATEPEPTTGEDPAVVLSGKMTLSVISLESENGGEAETTKTEDTTQEPVIEYIEEDVQKSIDFEDNGEEIVQEVEDREEGVATKTEEAEPIVQLIEEVLQPFTIEKEFLQKLKEENDIQPPLIMLESEDAPHTVEVEKVEREVDDLIQEAIENVQQRETKVDTLQTLSRQANEINDNLKNLGQTELETVQIPETSRKQTSLQVSGGVLEKEEKESPPKVEPKKEEIGSAIANAVQETKDEILGNTALTKSEVSEEKEVSPITRQIQDLINKEIEITEKIEEEHHVPVLECKIEPNQVEESDKEKTKPTEETQNSLSKTVENLELKESTDQINSVKVDHEETAKLDSAVVEEAIVVEKTKEQIDTTKSDKNLVEKVEEKPRLESKEAITPINKTDEVQAKATQPDEEELGSDEEIVEEIEEIVYEEESDEEVEEEEIEIEVEEEEESEEELPDDRNTNRTESSSVQRVNGERSEDLVEESKYTTASGATAAENDISDEELTDNEDVDDEEEIIEVEEEIEDDDYIGDEGNDVNHVSGDSEPEL